MTSLATYGRALRSTGTVLIPADTIFSAEELDLIDAVQAAIPEETVSSGDDDAHNIYIRRLVTDKVGERPTRVNQPISDQILAILDDERRRKIFAELLGATEPRFIRRCQLHRMVEGAYLGAHIDIESNPHNEFAVTVQLGREFTGGEFVVYPDGGSEQVILMGHGTVLVTTCRFRHEVRRVLTKQRVTLTYFYSRHDGVNERDPNVRCSRAGCRWCGEHLRSALDGA
jgi:hypothetical protein